MKALLFAVVIVCVLLGGWLFLVRHPDRVAPVMPDARATAAADEHASGPAKLEERSPASKPAPTVAATPPAQKPAAAHELNTAEIKALEIVTPPGVIEGIVLRGRDPITTGGLVYHRRGYFARIREDPRNATDKDKLGSTNIDGGGTFRIVGLDLGDYTLALDLGSGAEQETSVRLEEKKPGRRIVIVLGSATVKGHVYDLQGNPVAGARVEVSAEMSRLGPHAFETTRATAADGSYVITNVPAGPGWFTVLLSGDWTSRDTDLMQRITIAAGEVRVLDFGSPEPAKKWMGTLRSRNGDVVRGGGRLHLSHSDTKAYAEAKILEDGTFSVLIRPGEYSVQVDLNSNWGERIGFPSIRIGSIDVDHDLTITGTRVSGVVIDEATGQQMKGRSGLHVALRMRDSEERGHNGMVDENGRFAMDGVEPGVWIVSSYPRNLLGGVRELTVGEGDVELPLTLTVQSK